MKQPIPDTALDDRLFFGGTAGSGKTYNAGSRVERLLARKNRVVIPDPLGVWWGLRLAADGKKPSDYDVVIFGGPHGDLPLTEHAGALIGETVAGMKESCILDLSQLGTKAAEKRFMLDFLTALYRHTRGEPLHVIFDEADMWAPQSLVGEKEGPGPRLLGIMETIVRRGRVKGFIPWLISQRPAVLNKNVLSQADGIIAFKLTSSQDRDAIGAWVEGQADKATWKEMYGSLATMQRGQGVVWIPARSILDTVQFPAKETFDSSRTPKRGEKLARTADLKPIDLGAVKDRLATVEAERKADDPKALRTEAAALRRKVAELEAAKPAVDPDALAAAEERGFERAKAQLTAAAERRVREETVAFVKQLRERIAPLDAYLNEEVKRANGMKAELAKAVTFTPPPSPRPVAVRPVPAARAVAADPDRPLGAERRPLAVLAGVYPAGMTEAQWAVGAGLKRSGGTWSAYVSRLRSAGRIEDRGDLFFATEQGIADLGGQVVALPPPGPQLVEYWAGKISGVGPMLRFLAEQYPHFVTRDDLAAHLNLATSGGTFGAYLSRLRSPGLIEEDREKNLRAAPTLMEAAA
jgi:hypothetical protein